MGVQNVSRNPNPKDSMLSTWRADKSKWTHAHHVLNALDTTYDADPKTFPVFKKTDPIPVMSQISCNVWILAHALWPMGLQMLYWHITGKNMHAIGAFVMYLVAFEVNAIHEVHMFRKLAKQIGFFDGDEHARDQLPDVGIGKVLSSVELTVITRTAFTIFLGYRKNDYPHLSWYLPLELFLYSVILDFWFYLYHRSCHEIGSLWRYHRTHHLTKHPIPLLSAYADTEQEILEIAIIPLMTYACIKLLGLPMGFHDWWVCHQYLVFSEALGHSGLRFWGVTPGLSAPVLRLFGCELVIEDHDLHHRRGWRTSCNYGKQTRLWDRIFGTCGQRIESAESNVDRSKTIYFPWF